MAPLKPECTKTECLAVCQSVWKWLLKLLQFKISDSFHNCEYCLYSIVNDINNTCSTTVALVSWLPGNWKSNLCLTAFEKLKTKLTLYVDFDFCVLKSIVFGLWLGVKCFERSLCFVTRMVAKSTCVPLAMLLVWIWSRSFSPREFPMLHNVIFHFNVN